MKKCLVSFCFLFGVLAIAGRGSLTPFKTFRIGSETLVQQKSNHNGIDSVVTRVVDGDTVIINSGEKVRLIGINTPETVDPKKQRECFGKEASDESKKILTGRTVHLETDPSQDLYDKYGRMLAYVFLQDGTNFNQLMIENGYGYEYTYDLPYVYQKDFKQAEIEAQKNKRGLWASGVCGN